MKKYEYVEVQVKNNPVKDAKLSGHREIINDYALKGYKFCGFVPTLLGPSGKIIKMDLIFETEE